MRRQTRALVALPAVLAFAATATACGRRSDEVTGAGVPVVAASYPLAFAVEEIGGPGVEVENLTPPGVEPHDLELSARDVERIQSAEHVFYLGHGFQPAVADAAAGSVDPVDLLERLVLHQNGDPHVWLDPVRYGQMADEIGRVLDADAAAARFVARLDALDEELRAGLADCDRRTLVTSHEAFSLVVPRISGNSGRSGRTRVCCSETSVPHNARTVMIRPVGRRARSRWSGCTVVVVVVTATPEAGG